MISLHRTLISSLLIISTIYCVQAQGVTESQRQVLEILDKKKIEFQKTSNDSIFVTENSETPYRFIYLRRGDEPEDVEEEIFKAKPGEVVGPFRSEKQNYLFKILQHDSIRSRLKVSHIFVKSEGTSSADSTEALSKAQKIAKSLNKGDDFASLFQKQSADFKAISSALGIAAESVGSDGDLGWIWEGTTTPSINAALAKAKKGEAVVASSKYGSHVFFIQDKNQGFYKTKIISVVKTAK